MICIECILKDQCDMPCGDFSLNSLEDSYCLICGEKTIDFKKSILCFKILICSNCKAEFHFSNNMHTLIISHLKMKFKFCRTNFLNHIHKTKYKFKNNYYFFFENLR